MVNQGFKHVARHCGRQAPGLRTRHAALDDFALALIVAQRQTGLQLVVSDGCHHCLPLCNQVDNTRVDFVETLAQLEKFSGR